MGYWTINEMLGADAKWMVREDLVAEVAEVRECVLFCFGPPPDCVRRPQMGDTVYVKPMVHVLEHNAVPLRRVREFLGLPADKVTVLHFDPELSVGQYALSHGGRVRNNAALQMAATALKDEGFSRLALGVANEVISEGHIDRLFTLGLRGTSMERLHEVWLANRLPEAAFEVLRTRVVNRLGHELSGSSRSGSIYDTAKRM